MLRSDRLRARVSREFHFDGLEATGRHLTAGSVMTTANVTSPFLVLWILSLFLVLWPQLSSSAIFEQRGFIAKSKNQTLFVFGSTHLATAENEKVAALTLSPCFKSVAIEIDRTQKWGKALADGLPRPPLFSGSVLSEAEIARIAMLLSKSFNRTVSSNEVANVPAANLYYTLLALPLAPSGSSAGNGASLEVSLSQIASRDGLRVLSISYGEDHAQVLGSLKASDWTKLIVGVFSVISNSENDYQGFIKELDALEKLNFAGDFEAAFELADKSQRMRFGNPFGGRLHHLVHPNWVKRLKDLGAGAHVVVLGANHLGGNTGIKNLLAQTGYDIKRITVADLNCSKS
jgi:uncharacterized protein YbaP (TraB family)